MTGAQNADFDGDEDNISLALDKHMSRFWQTMDLSHSFLGMSKPFGASGLISPSKPLTASMANFLES